MSDGREGRFAWTHLGDTLAEYFAGGDLAYVVSPFISPDALCELLGRRQRRRTVVVTSWRLDHLAYGSSSLETYDVCQENEWTLYVNDALHAKVYARSLKEGWLGSANVTGAGLGFGHRANIEVLHHLPAFPSETRVWLQWLVASSRLVTDELHDWYRQRLDIIGVRGPDSIDLTTETPPTTIHDPFLISQLPASDSPHRMWEVLEGGEAEDWDDVLAAEHDLAIYGMKPTSAFEVFIEDLAKAFFAHPFVKALVEQIGSEGMRFGAVKEWVQHNCTDVPVPYRREITPYVQTLYTWFTTLDSDRFEVVRPRHSEILRIRKLRNT